MILSNLTDEQRNGRRSIRMDFRYEEATQPSRTLYFEADGPTAERMIPRAEGFAFACLPLALFHRERRLRIEAPLSTRLQDGLPAIEQIFRSWYPRLAPVAVEAAQGYAPTHPPAERRTASLFSGGIDGMATLRLNRLHYPLDHPESIRDCITLFGINNFDLDARGPVPERLDAFNALLQRLNAIASAESFTLHPVYTNVRNLAPNYRYWTSMGFGAAHIAACHLFQGHIDRLLYASDGDGANPSPGAWHPLIAPQFSTEALLVQPSEVAMSRVEKTALLCEWDIGRRYMQPCHYVRIPEAGRINCGRCEKCIRTMLALIGLGKLKEVSAFDEDDLPPARLFRMPVSTKNKAWLLRDTIPPLLKAGRPDLARAVRARLLLYHLLRR